MGAYAKGTTIRLTGTFTDLVGAAADPTAVLLAVETPSGVETTYTLALGTVTKLSTGIYYKDIAPDESGAWKYRWTGTGAIAVVDEDTYFYVKDTVFS